MKRWFISFKGLQGKFLIWLLLLGLIPQLAVSALAFWNGRRTVRERISGELVVTAFETIDKVERKLSERYADVQAWSQLSMFAEDIKKGSFDRTSEFLQRIIASSGAYHALAVFGRDGSPLVAVEHGKSPGRLEHGEHNITLEAISNRSNEDWFTAIVKDGKPIHVGHLAHSDVTKGFTIPLSSPIKDSNGSVVGVLVGFFNWEEIRRTVKEELAVSQKGALALVDSDGIVLYDTAIEEAALKANLLDMQPGVKGAIVEGSERGFIMEPHLGEDSAIGYAVGKGHGSYPGAGWSALAIVPSSEAFQPLSNLGRIILWAAIIASAFNIVVSSFIARSIANPLTGMVEVASKIANGDFRQTVRDTNKRDEVGQLGAAFNGIVEGMTEALGRVMRASARVTATSQELSDLSNKIKDNAKIIVGNIGTISQDAKMSSQTVEKAAASIQEMTASAQLIAGKSLSAAESSQGATKIAIQGRKIVDSAIATMGSIKRAVDLSSDVIEELSETSRQIGDMVATISNIAEQTNLLALNASIEAARAGEHGRGFAVVADEVGKLAEESGRAAEEIGRLLQGIQDKTLSAVKTMKTGTEKVDEGVRVVNDVGNHLGQIVEAVEVVSRMMEDISASVQEQSSNTEEMAKSMEEVSRVSERSLKGTSDISQIITGRQVVLFEEIASRADAVRGMAQELEDSVSQFKIASKEISEESLGLMQIEDPDVENKADNKGAMKLIARKNGVSARELKSVAE